MSRSLRDDLGTCALCPRLCRPSCPVASASTREAATPTAIASVLIEHERGAVPLEVAREAATLCTDCGACHEHCYLQRPLPEVLRRWRGQHLPAPQIEPLRPLEGEGAVVAVQTDDRPFAEALGRALGEPVRVWRTSDRLGAAAVEHEDAFEPHGRAIADAAAGLRVVVADGGVASALDAAGVPYHWAHELVVSVPIGGGSCCAAGDDRPLACCGGAEPLATHHPDDALRLGKAFAARLDDDLLLYDGRCRDHLARCGSIHRDVVDFLIGQGG